LAAFPSESADHLSEITNHCTLHVPNDPNVPNGAYKKTEATSIFR
jgi:hypothetical protein